MVRIELLHVDLRDVLTFEIDDVAFGFSRIEDMKESPYSYASNHSVDSFGWEKVKFWPSLALTHTQMKIMEVSRVENSIEECIWSSNPIAQAALKNNFPAEIDIVKSTLVLNFKFQVILFISYSHFLFKSQIFPQLSFERTSWVLVLSLQEINSINEFLLLQNPPEDDEDSVVTKLSEKSSWRGFLEFHKFVIHCDNIFRSYFQHAEVISAASIEVLVEVLEVK